MKFTLFDTYKKFRIFTGFLFPEWCINVKNFFKFFICYW